MPKPTVVQFGAGAIGRGFLGQLWTEGGYEVVFVDVNDDLIRTLSRRGGYPLRLFSPDGTISTTEIAPVRALNAADTSLVARELGRCAFACTAVGVNVFTRLAPLFADGFVRKVNALGGLAKLNVLCCENQNKAAALLRAEVEKFLPPGSPARELATANLAFVDASVGRMVPPPTEELLHEDPLLIAAESYKELPIDAAAWRGITPSIPGLLPKPNFDGYVARKLFIHNGGHAVLAYHGWLKGHVFIYQCAEDTEIINELRGFWGEVGSALVAAYGFDKAEQRAHQEDLLQRFRNRALGDTVVRVGRDPARKLRRDDRLVGAALFCEGQGVAPRFAARAIAAALRFDPADDPSAANVQEERQKRGVKGTMALFSHLGSDTALAGLVEDAYNTVARD